jgi:GAF domain-containing protein
MSNLDRALDQGREALRRFLVGDDDMDEMLQTVTLIVTESVADCDLASITLIRNGRPTTPVFTDKVAERLDQAQYELGDGPCLAAIRHQGVERVKTATDERWGPFNVAAREQGVESVLSVPLIAREVGVGSLNLYSRHTAAFGGEVAEVACGLADQLGVAAVRAAFLSESYELAQQLQQALESRAIIEQAKGILMGVQGCGPDEAFEILKRASQNRNRKLRAVAEEIVERRRAAPGAATAAGSAASRHP